MTIKKAFRSIGIVALVAISAFLILCFAVPSAKSVINQKTQTVKDIKIVGLGDSLTEGVGDETKQGGYLPLIKGDLEATNRYRVTTQNLVSVAIPASRFCRVWISRPKSNQV
nr:hypothetical protein [Lacticaseibacillus saniviri]